MPKESPLIDRLGGTPVLKRTLDVHYERVLRDSLLAPFFKGTKMSSLRLHQLKFLRYFLSDGRMTVDVTDVMLEKHMSMFEERDLSAVHFDRFVTLFVDSLKACGVRSQGLLDETHEIMAPLRQIFVIGAQEYGGSVKSQEDAETSKEHKRKGLRRLLGLGKQKG
jgi:truncated hemoglobin YjbI